MLTFLHFGICRECKLSEDIRLHRARNLTRDGLCYSHATGKESAPIRNAKWFWNDVKW